MTLHNGVCTLCCTTMLHASAKSGNGAACFSQSVSAIYAVFLVTGIFAVMWW
jgi:hypothetical protein